jgi:hypothetical protein
LTPSLKLRRKVIYEKYHERIDALYGADQLAADSAQLTSNGGTA